MDDTFNKGINEKDMKYYKYVSCRQPDRLKHCEEQHAKTVKFFPEKESAVKEPEWKRVGGEDVKVQSIFMKNKDGETEVLEASRDTIYNITYS